MYFVPAFRFIRHLYYDSPPSCGEYKALSKTPEGYIACK